MDDRTAMIPFTPSHRGGEGPPLVLLHGFLESWRSWELVLPALERRHDVLALTLPGHAGGPALDGPATGAAMVDAVEAAMDAAGLPTAHLAGNSLGGWLTFALAARGRAHSVVAFAPAGGWARDDEAFRELLAFQRDLQRDARAAAPHAAALVATPDGRRRASATVSERSEHIPAELLSHRIEAAASCRAAEEMIDEGLRGSWDLDAARIDVPVRIVWGMADRLLPWPAAAVRYRTEWLPQADWVVLDDVGHAPQLDVPLEAAELVLGLTAGWPRAAR